MEQGKEEQFFRKHLLELAKRAYHKEQAAYTDFLNINEISIFHSMEKELPMVPYSMWGGHDFAERCKICFHGDVQDVSSNIALTEQSYTNKFPIDCLSILPSNEKYAEELTHRDYLGAILNLGIERIKVGDIIVQEKSSLVFVDSMISDYIMTQLQQVKHTKIHIKQTNTTDATITPKFLQITGTVMSIRLDAIVATACSVSRGTAAELIKKERVYLNGKIELSNSATISEGDMISIRGIGKFIFEQQGKMTKKGRIVISIKKYC